jgi:hypothetical protein
MKSGSFLLTLLFFIPFIHLKAQAAPQSEKVKERVQSLSACGNFIRFDNENVYTGFGPYRTGPETPRMPKASILKYSSIDQNSEDQVSTLDSVVDVLKVKGSTYILTYSGIEEWDLSKKQRMASYTTSEINGPFDDEEHPRAFALYKDQLVIAHGRLGLTIFDLNTKKIIRTLKVAEEQKPLESVVNGVSVSGKYAFAVLDNYSLVGPKEKPAFRGVAIIDLELGTIISELDGLPPGADSLVTDESSAIVSFYGVPLWKFSLKSLMAQKLPKPMRRVWKFPLEGHPTGKPSMDDKYYYTCFLKAPGPGEGAYFKKVPTVLDRRTLMLD